MKLLLERANIVPPEEKLKIMEALNMFDKLWDESPMVQRMKEESEARGEAKGKAEGELAGSQKMLVSVINTRFPTLTELAQQRITQVHDTNVLNLLVRQVVIAPDENTIRWLLDSIAA